MAERRQRAQRRATRDDGAEQHQHADARRSCVVPRKSGILNALPVDPAVASRTLSRGIHIGLPLAILDVGVPGRSRPASTTVDRHRHVVELLGHLAAVVVGPVEEVEHLLAGLGLVLLLVHQDEGRAGDRPALLARLVGQQQVEARRLLSNRHWPPPPGSSCCSGATSAPSLFTQLRVGQLVLQRIGVFDIADRAVGARRPARRRPRCPCRRGRPAIRPRCSRRPCPSTPGSTFER